MSRRAELYTLIRSAKAHLELAQVGPMPGVRPASQEERDVFDEVLAARRARKTQAMREALDFEKPKVAEPKPTAVAPRPSGSKSVPLWEQFGSKPKEIFASATAELEELWAPEDDHATRLLKIRENLGDCKRCGLCETRKKIVFGEGSPTARLMFVGEGPGYNEDIQGRPFVGKAGELLDKMIEAMGLKREDVYIANTVKCRPPEDRNPAPDEIAKCRPFIMQQVRAIEPEVIVGLGRFGTNVLLDQDKSITQIRGTWQDFDGIALMPTFHPAYLLRNPGAKRDAWADLQAVMKKLGLSN